MTPSGNIPDLYILPKPFINLLNVHSNPSTLKNQIGADARSMELKQESEINRINGHTWGSVYDDSTVLSIPLLRQQSIFTGCEIIK